MLNGKKIGVVVPAFNEEKLIGRVFSTMPEFVDRIIAIDDASTDTTLSVMNDYASRDNRILIIPHKKNAGLGASLIDGYLKAKDLRIDVTAVMAGDAQMAPSDLENVIKPVATGEVDYVKGNRLLREEVVSRMPAYRFIGNGLLSFLSKFATGYWQIIDPQCGYTAISLKALQSIPIQKMIKGYGYNAHILHMLNLNNFLVRDVSVEPVYGDEKSKIKLRSYIPRVSWLLIKLFTRRMSYKYLVRDFNPLIFFYCASLINLGISALLGIRFFYLYNKLGEAPSTTLILLNFTFSVGLLSFFFGMWLDMEDNRVLKG